MGVIGGTWRHRDNGRGIDKHRVGVDATAGLHTVVSRLELDVAVSDPIAACSEASTTTIDLDKLAAVGVCADVHVADIKVHYTGIVRPCGSESDIASGT